jgi:hypothetical protein
MVGLAVAKQKEDIRDVKKDSNSIADFFIREKCRVNE